MDEKTKEPSVMDAEEGTTTELARVDSGSLAILNRSEIEQQVTTAKRYPRSIKRFRDESMEMVTISEKIAAECIYAVPRGGKMIEGPSARFAEIIVSAWGNSRAGARIISVGNETITAQGFFFDVERNVTIALEIERRITDKQGRRYNADMIATTGNAAASIAVRNAVLKGIPKAFWTDMYDSARAAAIGTVQTLSNKRAEMVAYFQKMGVTADMICLTLEVPGIEDIGLDDLAKLKGMATALKEGESTPEQLFSMPEKPEKAAKGTAGLKEKIKDKEKGTPAKETPAKDAADAPGAPAATGGLTTPPPKESPKGEPFPDPGKASPAKEEPPGKPPEQVELPKTPPPTEKTAPKDAPGSKETPAPEPESPVIQAITGIFRAVKSIEDLDKEWRKQVEQGQLIKEDKQKLSMIYSEVYSKLRKEAK